jgi:hypothetical protein
MSFYSAFGSYRISDVFSPAFYLGVLGSIPVQVICLALGQDFFVSFGIRTPILISPTALHSLSIPLLDVIDAASLDLGAVPMNIPVSPLV